MGILRVKGIVIKEVHTEEADKIITIYAKDKGKISAYAKGARRPRSRLIAGTQLFCYSEFILFTGREIYNISSCELIEPFYGIRDDMNKLTYAAYILSLVEDVLQENQSLNKVLKLFLNALYLLSDSDKSPELIARIFELRFISILGYTPVIGTCVSCNNQCTGELFSYKLGGSICQHCSNKDMSCISISAGTVKALEHIIKSSKNELFSFGVSPMVLKELEIVNRNYLKDKLEKDYNKLDFLKKFNC